MNLEAALQQIVENGPNPTEFVLISSPTEEGRTFDPGRYLESWVAAFSHRLREADRRNPTHKLDRSEVRSFIQERLERDIVFNTNGIDAAEAESLASAIVESIKLVEGAAISFPIEDWTFSDVLVAQGEKLVCVLAFLGED